MRLAMVRRERRDDCHGNHRRYADHHDQLPRLRKVKSKNKVKIFIMNNVFSCLLVKTLYFGTLSLGNNSFVRSIKFIIISIRSIIFIRRIGTYFPCIYIIGRILGMCIICMYATLCMYKIVHKLIMCSITCCRK